MSLSLMDAITNNLSAVYVTIDSVSVHLSAQSDEEDDADSEGWQTVASPSKTYNLLELTNGTMEKLGAADLPTGHYSQIRLLLGDTPDTEDNLNSDAHPYANYIVTNTSDYHELKVPSGYHSGIKLVHGFDVEDGQTIELMLDFDAARSVVMAGNSAKYLLKPTIKIKNKESSGTLQGTVSDGGTPIENAMISAQKYNPTPSDIMNHVNIHGSAATDENGLYQLTLQSGTYTLAAYKSGFTSFCQRIIIEPEKTVEQDIDLTPDSSTPGTLSGTVTIPNGNIDDYITLSIRQSVTCQDSSEVIMVEIAAMRIAHGGSFDESLTPGNYDIVASGEGLDTQTYTNVEITTGTITPQNIVF